MSTYKASFKQFPYQGLSVHYSQNSSETIIKCTKPFPCSYPESQSGLYLDISLRQNSKNQQNWTSFQNHLKQLFDQIVQLDHYPNSSVKITIFILQEGSDIKACIINALWLLLLKMGINMKKSIYCLQHSIEIISPNSIQTENNPNFNDGNCVVYNLNDYESIIEGEMSAHQIRNTSENSQKIQQQLKQYKDFVIDTFKKTLLN